MSRYARFDRSAASRRATGVEGAWHDAAQRDRAQARAAQDRRRRRHDRRAQVVRRLPRAARHQPPRHQGRAHRDLRAVGLRQVDHDPLHQPAGGAPAGPHHRRRHRAHQRPEEDRRGAPRRRHGVPAFQPVPASDRAGEPDAGADLGAQACRRSEAEEIAMHYLQRVKIPEQAGKYPGPAVRRPAAARRDRARALHEPEDHAVRRADLGARSRRWSRRCSTPWCSSPRTA